MTVGEINNSTKTGTMIAADCDKENLNVEYATGQEGLCV